MQGAREFSKFSSDYLAKALSIHHVLAPRIEITSPTTAKGVWVMTDIPLWENGDPIEGYKEVRGWGHYHEQYVKRADGWRICAWELTRVKLDRTK
jgi:hypothetical protein